MSEILEQINEPDVNLVGKKFIQKDGNDKGMLVEVIEDKNYILKIKQELSLFCWNINKSTFLKHYEAI